MRFWHFSDELRSITLCLIQEERTYNVPVLDSIDGDSLTEKTHIEDVQKESNTNEVGTTEDIIDDKRSTALITPLESSSGDTSTPNHQVCSSY